MIEDPRHEGYIEHKLSDILLLVMGAVISGMTELADMMTYFNSKLEFYIPDLGKLEDLGKLDALNLLEAEQEQFELPDIKEPNPTHQMEVEVGTFVELQRAIYSAQPDTALVINITRNIEFDDVIVIEGGLDITISPPNF